MPADSTAWHTWQVLADVGSTGSEPDGYDVHASIVQTPQGGVRVRLTLRRNGQAHHHLDITGPLAQRVWPLVREAADAAKGLVP